MGPNNPPGFLCSVLSRFLSKQMCALPVPSDTRSSCPTRLPERQPGKQSSLSIPIVYTGLQKSPSSLVLDHGSWRAWEYSFPASWFALGHLFTSLWQSIFSSPPNLHRLCLFIQKCLTPFIKIFHFFTRYYGRS